MSGASKLSLASSKMAKRRIQRPQSTGSTFCAWLRTLIHQLYLNGTRHVGGALARRTMARAESKEIDREP